MYKTSKELQEYKPIPIVVNDMRDKINEYELLAFSYCSKLSKHIDFISKIEAEIILEISNSFGQSADSSIKEFKLLIKKLLAPYSSTLEEISLVKEITKKVKRQDPYHFSDKGTTEFIKCSEESLRDAEMIIAMGGSLLLEYNNLISETDLVNTKAPSKVLALAKACNIVLDKFNFDVLKPLGSNKSKEQEPGNVEQEPVNEIKESVKTLRDMLLNSSKELLGSAIYGAKIAAVSEINAMVYSAITKNLAKTLNIDGKVFDDKPVKDIIYFMIPILINTSAKFYDNKYSEFAQTYSQILMTDIAREKSVQMIEFISELFSTITFAAELKNSEANNVKIADMESSDHIEDLLIEDDRKEMLL